jgi:hypothetical protein
MANLSQISLKGEEIMKRLTTGVIGILLLGLVSACASTHGMESKHMVKCPACGYEFQTPATP